MIRLSNWLGRQIFEFLESTGRTAQLLFQTLIQLRRINIRHVIYQMAHLGVDTMPIVFMMIVFTGMVMVWQATPALSRAGAQSTTGGLVALAMFRELGPVLSAVVLAGRVGAAITAEIGSMKVTEQIDALRVMATDPIAYLVAPPLEATFGIDAAMKSADVQLVTYVPPPSETNYSAAFLTGSQAACKAACNAFTDAVLDIARHPVQRA